MSEDGRRRLEQDLRDVRNRRRRMRRKLTFWRVLAIAVIVIGIAGAAALAGVLAGVKVASIGPVTSATARDLGIEVTVEASVFTVDGLVEAILREVSLKRKGHRGLPRLRRG